MIKASLKEYSRLPTIPAIAVQILKMFDNPNAGVKEIVDVVNSDPAIASRLIRAVNSAQYGSWGEVTDLRRAVMLLGKNAITPLVLSFSLCKPVDLAEKHVKVYRSIWLRSVAQAITGEVIGLQRKAQALAADGFVTGLLANIGQLALMKTDAEGFTRCIPSQTECHNSVSDRQREAFGFTDQELTLSLLEHVGMPARCLDAVRAIPTFKMNSEDALEVPSLAFVVKISDTVARLLCGESRGVDMVQLEELLESPSLKNQWTSESLLEAVRKQLDARATNLSVDAASLPDHSELLQMALEQLAEFSVSATTATASQDVPQELLEENGQLKRRVRDLIRKANTDALTGLYCRGYFDEQLREAAAVAAIRENSIGLAILDIDFFKKVNDTHGHLTGDEVLKEVARALQGTLRDHDVVARYGGEEFVIILNEAEQSTLGIIGERLRKTVENLKIKVDDKSIPVTTSVGIAAGYPHRRGEHFLQELFSAADSALYRAKGTGRNRVVVELSFDGVTPIPRSKTLSLRDAASETLAPV